jgi:type IV secretory pathway VirB4 component
MSSNIPPRTQDHLDIDDIISDIIILKDGSAAMVLQVSAVNFGLLSEKEQDATIYAYAQLLNSLTFSIQIIISSKRKDISVYLEKLDLYLSKITASKLKDQLTKYRDFVQAIVTQGNVLDKKFYISIPFSSLELGLGSSIKALGGQSAKKTLPKEYIVDRANTNLAPKRDHLLRLLSRIGLKGRQLTSAELLQLFFDAYNPDMIGTRVSLPHPEPPPKNPPGYAPEVYKT